MLGINWGIVLKDSPDIKLIDASTTNLKKRSQLIVEIEVFQFPKMPPDELKKNFVPKLLKSVIELIFDKRYVQKNTPGSWLIINIMENEPNEEQIKELAEEIQKNPKNPYSEICLTTMPALSKLLRMDMLYPKFKPTSALVRS